MSIPHLTLEGGDGSYNLKIRTISTDVAATSLADGKHGTNVSIGINSLNVNTGGVAITGLRNVQIGVGTGGANAVSGVDNVGVGYHALDVQAAGINNTAVGSGALALSGVLVGSADNVAVGKGAGAGFIHAQSTFLGSGADGSAARTNSTAVGYGAVVAADNTVMVGGTGVTNVLYANSGAGTVTLGSFAAPLASIYSTRFPVRIGAIATVNNAPGTISLAHLQGGFMVFTGNGGALTMPTPADLTTFTGGGLGASCCIRISNQLTAAQILTLTANGLTSVPAVAFVSTSSATVLNNFTLWFVCTVANTTWQTLAI